jgi:hypothetical protein
MENPTHQHIVTKMMYESVTGQSPSCDSFNLKHHVYDDTDLDNEEIFKKLNVERHNDVCDELIDAVFKVANKRTNWC